MITVRSIYPSGALEVSALVMGAMSRQVWMERQTYYGYKKSETRRLFIQHLTDSGFVQVND